VIAAFGVIQAAFTEMGHLFGQSFEDSFHCAPPDFVLVIKMFDRAARTPACVAMRGGLCCQNWGLETTPDKVKGHDFQFWSSPLKFDGDGNIAKLTREDDWSIELKP
jgi:hypothetical protein